LFGGHSTDTPKHHWYGAVALGGVVLATGVLANASPAAAAEGDATVSLTVNGVTTSVTTSADTVSQLLTQQSVPYDSTDIVRPGLSAQVVDGLDVTWRPAIRVVVRKDGKRSVQRVTATHARAVKSQLQLPTGTSGSYRRQRAFSYNEGRLYTKHGRILNGDDVVRENSIAVVHTFRVAFSGHRKHLKQHVVRDRSKLVRKGGTRVYRMGHNGIKHVVYRTKRMDGRLVAKHLVKSKVVRHTQRRVVKVGTGPNWVGLARCESSGNPNAVNPAGFYGLYQFTRSTWHSVGGKGSPTDYGYWEQTKRAWKLFRRDGRSPWPVCGRFL
jgi:uncharacterized protein YabE (DUF348 family)